MGREGLLSYDVEPVIGSAEQAGKRLMGRLCGRYPKLAEQFEWSPTTDASIVDVPPDAAVKLVRHSLVRTVWEGV